MFVEKIKQKKRRYVTDYTDEMDISRASSACDCTGLMPSLPQSDEEVRSYKNMYDFSPVYVSDES